MHPDTPRSGRYLKQRGGYSAWTPAPLPPDPPLQLDAATLSLLSRADQAIGRLDGVSTILPSSELFVAMYVRREAVYSSQIEGTQSTLEDVLNYELDPENTRFPRDVEEVVAYVRAMNHGIERLATLPLSLRLIREIHAELMRGVWGAEKRPGEFRTSQNWIGPAGAPLSRATFVPPAVSDMLPALDSLEKFLHSGRDIPVLVHCALVHAQFETIHPFLDGNGRVGRLLITFQLVHREVLRTPLLYLSLYLKRRQSEYYYWLNAVREDGGWEGWVRFFLQGIAETAEEATATAVAIIRLREEHRELLQERGMGGQELRLLDLLYRSPLVSANWLKEALGLRNYQAAGRLIERLAALGLLEEITGRRRNRIFRYTSYWRLFEESYAGVGQDAPTQTTETEA